MIPLRGVPRSGMEGGREHQREEKGRKKKKKEGACTNIVADVGKDVTLELLLNLEVLHFLTEV